MVSNPTPTRPLDVRITTENKKDQKWAGPFAKKHIRLPDRYQKPVAPTPVGDSFIKTDGFGIQYVISPTLNPQHRTPKTVPVILPTAYWLTDGKLPPLVPSWPETHSSSFSKDPLQFLNQPSSHVHNLFGERRFSLELNPLLQGIQEPSLHVNSENDIVEVHLSVWKPSPDTLPSILAALAMTTKLNHDKPMRITINSAAEDSEILKILMATEGWEKVTLPKRSGISTTFDYDPKTTTLVQGTLPGGILISSRPDGRISLKPPKK